MTANKKTIKYGVVSIVSLLVLVGLAYYMYYNSAYPNTDDAYLNAHVIQVPAQVTGLVDHVYVADHQRVSQGQPLFSIDKTAISIALAKAQANLALVKSRVKAAEDNQAVAASLIKQRQAEYSLAQTTLSRYQALYKNHYIAKQILDNNIKQLAVAKTQLLVARQQYQQAKNEVGGIGDLNAQIELSQSNIAAAELDLKHSTVYAPASGIITQFSLRKGDAVNAYQTNFSLIEDGGWWVDANFKETQLDKIHVGQQVDVTIDMYPDHVFSGNIVAISYGSGDSFSLMPAENASGNWVKVTQRFAVKIKIKNTSKKLPLRVGASASVRVHA